MSSRFLFPLLFHIVFTADSSSFERKVETDKGVQILKYWKKLQDKYKKLPYDVDACYGWIGLERPKRGEFSGLALTPNCYIIQDDLTTFKETFHRANREYERFSEDPLEKRDRCKSNHLFIARLHRLDEGGLFSYHYTRVRMNGNKIQVTFFALKDVLEEGIFYQPSVSNYEHPSVKFYSAEQFPSTFVPFVVYTIDYEINVWFKTLEGLRLYNYRLTWDATNSDNGYHVDVFKRFSVPHKLLDPDSVAYIVTSDQEVHYFFVKNIQETYDVFFLKHTDLIKGDFSQLEKVKLGIPVDVYPRNILGRILPYYALTVVRKAIRFNKQCLDGAHVEFYSNKTSKYGEVTSILPNITDPPLANNIFATHFRSAYPFVQNGRTRKKPNYEQMIVPIVLTVMAALLSRWIVLGYDVFPTSWSRSIRLMILSRRHFIFKARAHNTDAPFSRLFYILYRLEVGIRKGGKKVYNSFIWIVQIESNDDEGNRLLGNCGQSQDQPSQRDASTPND